MDPFKRMAKARSDALTELFHRYLEFIYQNHLRRGENKIWMREGDLDKLLGGPYPEQTLRCVLCDNHTAAQGLPNIFIFQGEKGDGRRFFIRKMLEVCYKCIHHIGWEQAQDESVHFRFPVHIPKSMTREIAQGNGTLDLVELACLCVIRQLELTDECEMKTARKLVTELGHMGKLVATFEEETCKEIQNLIDRLDTPAGLEHQPIAVFIELPQLELRETVNGYCIRMEPLTVSQIVKYLTAELPEQYNFNETQKMLQEQSEVVALLQKPERIQIQIRMVRENREPGTPTTVTQFYDAFLSAQIDRAFETQTDQKLDRQKLEDWLTQLAKGEKPQDPQLDENCRKCFENTEIFHKHLAGFRFEGCKYYLIAKSYISPDLTGDNVYKRLLMILMNEDLMVLKFFSLLYLHTVKQKDQKVLFQKLTSLMDNPKVRERHREPAGLLADVLTFTNRVETDGSRFVEWAGKEMQKYTYDTSVLETLSKLNQASANAEIANCLVKRYTSTKDAREKRRIAYCFGYMGQGNFPSQLLDDLCATNPLPPVQEKLHLQYHISAALVDSCCELEDIQDHYAALEQALSRHTDPILRSDFETLFTRLNESKQQYRDAQNQCENQLIYSLEHGPYWQKAHAAGALGRRSYRQNGLGIRSVVTKLIHVLDNTLTTIFRLQDEGYKELKTVSYIVEACCQLAVNNNYRDDVKTALRNQLVKHLSNLSGTEVSIIAYKHLQAALKLVGTGLRYLLDGEGSIRTELGLCFSSKESFLQALSGRYQREQGADWLELKGALQQLEEWSTPEGAEWKLTDIFSEKPRCGRKLSFSLTYLWHGGWPMMVGFLFLFQSDIYFITCRHCFFEDENIDKPRLSDKELSQVSFSPACLDDHGRYHGVMCYPDNLFAPASFDEHANEDIVIYRLTDIPAIFSQVIFSEQDLPSRGISQNEQLEAFSFPRTSRTQGKWFQCSNYKVGAHGFFTMHTNQQFGKRDVDWFSGAPVTNASKAVVGMWKGSKDESRDIWGITIQSILDKLKQIDKNGGNGNE